ncbi:MAG TPA: hypothetical protein VKB73_07190 [Gaiellaceae bacterium]|nr:hypothetical protein [Gaiellaceae bacterium]
MLSVGGATGRLGADDFPDPVGAALVLAFGCALLPVGALLWRLSNGPPSAPLLRTLATANLATAAVLLAWFIAAAGFSPAGTAIALATVACLVGLGALQLAAGRLEDPPASVTYNS